MKNIFRIITIEPSYFLFIIVLEWLKEIDANLWLQKTCRLDHLIEPDLNTQCDDEKKGLLYVTEVNSKYGSVASFLSVIIAMFAAIWSDEAGRRRRPLIFISLFGIFLRALSGCLNSYFWHWNPSIAVASWVTIYSTTGGIAMMLIISQTYLCDISDAEDRTMRLVLSTAVRAVGTIAGKGGFGFVLRWVGFLYFYALCLLLSVISLILAVILIRDTSVPVEKKVRFGQMFSLRRVLLIDSFKVTFSRKLAGKRTIIVLLLVANVAINCTSVGELSVLYVYLRRRFQWDERMYSKYVFFKFSASTLGALFCSFVLSKRLKIHDGLIGILATVCDTMAITGLLFAFENWQLYTIPVMDMFHGTVYTVSISFMSKYYDKSELGRLNAVNGAFMLLVPFSYYMYNKVLQITFDVLPSAFCLLSIVLNVTIFLCFVGSYFLSKKFASSKPVTKEEEPMASCVK
ncbi:tetracycline resistance protein, class C-like [Planococcus citri]|uniref:tetracycline resistance protein, class C-like n=1 Tax=Planococcus citri TaxID=170843 RepID=UPI0031F7AC7F